VVLTLFQYAIVLPDIPVRTDGPWFNWGKFQRTHLEVECWTCGLCRHAIVQYHDSVISLLGQN